MKRFTQNPRAIVGTVIAVLMGLALFAVWRTGQPDASEGAPPSGAFEAVVVSDTSALGGRLFFVEQRAQPNYRIARLDLASRVISTAFSIPPEALVYQIAPGGNVDELLLTYSAPPATGANTYDRNGIYTLNLKTGALTQVLGEKANVYYSYPRQVGNRLVYALYDVDKQSRRIEAYDLASRAVNVLATNAVLPALAPDGLTVAWLSVNPQTQANSLWVNSGSAPTQLVAETAFPDLDHPMFSADGKWVYFSAVETKQARRVDPFDLGVRPAAAHEMAHGNHNLPARWYRVAVTGGKPEALTPEPKPVRAGALNQDTIGFVSDTGFYVFNVARSQPVTEIIRSRALGAIAWLP